MAKSRDTNSFITEKHQGETLGRCTGALVGEKEADFVKSNSQRGCLQEVLDVRRSRSSQLLSSGSTNVFSLCSFELHSVKNVTLSIHLLMLFALIMPYKCQSLGNTLKRHPELLPLQHQQHVSGYEREKIKNSNSYLEIMTFFFHK